MPCADYRDYSDCSDYQKRNDELARRLCRMGMIISMLYRGLPVDPNEMMWALRIHKEHRGRDKQAALKVAKSAALTLDANILKIRALGGEPKQEILDLYEAARHKAQAIEDSDPLDTVLY
jgi:hypothetical protein